MNTYLKTQCSTFGTKHLHDLFKACKCLVPTKILETIPKLGLKNKAIQVELSIPIAQ